MVGRTHYILLEDSSRPARSNTWVRGYTLGDIHNRRILGEQKCFKSPLKYVVPVNRCGKRSANCGQNLKPHNGPRLYLGPRQNTNPSGGENRSFPRKKKNFPQKRSTPPINFIRASAQMGENPFIKKKGGCCSIRPPQLLKQEESWLVPPWGREYPRGHPNCGRHHPLSLVGRRESVY